MRSAVWFLAFVSVAAAREDSFPWMNNYVACTLRMPVYNYEPTILMKGTYDIKADKSEFKEGTLIKVQVGSEEPSGMYKGLFITVLEDGKSRGEWIAGSDFKSKTCHGSANSALTEMTKSSKSAKGHTLTWRAPRCDPGKTYEMRATVIRDENEFQPNIKIPLRCQMDVGMADKSDTNIATYPEGEPVPEGSDMTDDHDSSDKGASSSTSSEHEYYYDAMYYNQETDQVSLPGSSNTEPIIKTKEDAPISIRKAEPDQRSDTQEGTVDYYYDMYSYGDTTMSSNPEPESSNPEPESTDFGDHGITDDDKASYPENKPIPENTRQPSGQPEPPAGAGAEPESTPWEEDGYDEAGKESSDPEGEPAAEPESNPEPESQPQANMPPMYVLFRNIGAPVVDRSMTETPPPSAEPENVPETLPMYVLFRNVPEPPASDSEDSHEPEDVGWQSHDDKEYKTDSEKGLNLPSMNPEPTSEPESEPEPEGWKEDEDKEHPSQAEPEKKPSTPPMFVLFRGAPEPTPSTEPENSAEPENNSEMPPINPEPTSEPESEPLPEGEGWRDDEDKEYKSQPDPEKKPSTPQMNVLFRGGPEPAPSTEPENTPEPENNSGMPLIIPEPTSEPESEPEPEGEGWQGDEDKEYKSQSDPEKKPAAPPLNVLFGGAPEPTPSTEPENTPEPENNSGMPHMNPEPTSGPEGEPVPEGEGWQDDKDKEYQSQAEPEKKPSTPPMFVLFKSEPEPTPSTEPENTPEPDTNSDMPHINPEPTSEPESEPRPEGEGGQDGKDEEYKSQSYSSKNVAMPFNNTEPIANPESEPQPEPESGGTGIEREHDDSEDGEGYAKSNTMPSPENGSTVKMEYQDTSSEPSPEMRPKPVGISSTGCDNSIYPLPEGASTSFENGDFGGWSNDTDAKRPWILKKGPTSSPATGPSSAFDGKYYVYMEGSRPAKQGDQAILKGPSGIRGCFCIKFACHMYVDEMAHLELKVNGKSVNENRFAHMGWQKMTTSIVSDGESVIEIVATRGMTFRSDIAIDDIKVTPGICPEDM